MLLLLLITHVSVSLAVQCDLTKVAIIGGSYTVSDGGNVGSKVEYQCPKGKYPYPKYTRECQYNGFWTDQKAKTICKDVRCPRPVTFEDGDYEPRQPFYKVGDTLYFECYSGFTMKGPQNRTCQENAKWTGETTICDDNNGYCPNPGIPIGASKSGSSYKMENKVSYNCQQGLVMFGSKERECLEDKSWSGTEPSCRQWYTYDTPKEVAKTFSSSMLENVDTTNLEDRSDRSVRILKDGLMNIFIVLDTSKSVGQNRFDEAKSASILFIEKMSNYDIKPRYCIISYASKAISVVSLRDPDSNNADAVMEHLEEFQYDRHEDKQGTNTRAALHAIYEHLIEQELAYEREGKKEDFMKIHNVILLMTDGKFNMGGDPREEMKLIKRFLDVGIRKDNPREEYLDVYVFGLGSDIDQPEINDLASKKEKEVHTFHLQNVEKMKEFFELMIIEDDVFDTCGLSKYHSVELDPKKKATVMFPWIVKITITHNGIQYCKGTILSQYFILTAAHCFDLDDKTQKIHVKIDGKEYLVKDFYRHPKYDPISKKDKGIKRAFDYDVALLELQRNDKIEFSENARPICIPCTQGTAQALKQPGAPCSSHEKTLLSEEEVKAVFIAEESNKPMKEMHVLIKRGQKRSACLEAAKKAPELKNVTNIEDAVTDQFLCTGGIVPVADPPVCKGDSGGPLLIQVKRRYVQVGIISWGTVDHCDKGTRIKQTQKNARDFYQDIFKVLPWIQKVLEEKHEVLTFLPN
ncbi:complement factor B precursor [Xenopus laevis]|uniref:Complement factor B n=1 Tax=Xenopus laevis TaxID=8355 RepID=Q91900_XENLA|nr:complement factor B precursor [Xenopus laevis]BAA06179.1 complement factor B [Xenopus laevis]